MGISFGGTPLNLLYCLAVGSRVTEWPRMRGCLDARCSEIKVGWSRQTGQVDPTGLEWRLGLGLDIISGGRRFRYKGLGSGWEEGPPACPAAPPGGTHCGCSPAGVQGTPQAASGDVGDQRWGTGAPGTGQAPSVVPVGTAGDSGTFGSLPLGALNGPN